MGMAANTPEGNLAPAYRANPVDSPHQKSLRGNPSIQGAIYPKRFSPDPQKEPGGTIRVQNESESITSASPALTNKALSGNLLRTSPKKPGLPPLTYAAALRRGIAPASARVKVQQKDVIINGGDRPCVGDTERGDIGDGYIQVTHRKNRSGRPEPEFPQTLGRKPSERYNNYRDIKGKSSQIPPRNAIQSRNGRPERQAAVVSITAPMIQRYSEPPLDHAFLKRFSQDVNTRNKEIWKKILRVDRKDRCKVRKDHFTKAMEAVGFKPENRGGSQYTFIPRWLSTDTDTKPITFHLHCAIIEPTELGNKSQSIRENYPSMVRSMYKHWGVKYDPCADRR